MSNLKLSGDIYLPKAIQGKSAYELALMNGYQGTEEEWLNSLNGGLVTVDKQLYRSGHAADAKVTGEKVAELYGKIAEEANDLNRKIAVESARVTNLSTLEEGSTTGDAELADIRVGADGTVYDSAGEAVRRQVGVLSAGLLQKAPLGAIGEGNLLFDCKYVDNKYWNTGEYDSQAYGYFEMSVTSGTTYYFKPFARFVSAIVNGIGTVLNENSEAFTPDFSGKIYVTFPKYPSNLDWIASIDNNFDSIRSYNKPYNHKDFFAQGIGDNDNIALSQQAVKDNFVSKKTANLFNYETSRNGYLSSSDGGVTENANYETSDYIPIRNGESIVFNSPIRKLIAFSDQKAPLGTVEGERQEAGYVFTPDRDGFIMISYWVVDKYNFMVEYGTKPSNTYFPYNSYIFEKNVFFNDERANKNILFGKKYVACGDSFTEGQFESADFPYTFTDGKYNGKNMVYPYFIGLRNAMDIVNEAKSGSCITDAASNSFSHANGRYTQIPEDADYITLKFGINDWHINAPIGTIDDTTNTTFYGAWNVVMEYLITHHPLAKIGIIITNGLNGEGGEAYAEAERNIAKKWGVSFLDEDMGEQVGLVFRSNRTDVCEAVKTLRFNAFKVSDTNGHPNVKCHEYESTIIENWLRSL